MAHAHHGFTPNPKPKPKHKHKPSPPYHHPLKKACAPTCVSLAQALQGDGRERGTSGHVPSASQQPKPSKRSAALYAGGVRARKASSSSSWSPSPSPSPSSSPKAAPRSIHSTPPALHSAPHCAQSLLAAGWLSDDGGDPGRVRCW
jgi:hypothetical protein